MFHQEIEGAYLVKQVIARLVDESAYFEVEPLPDDLWEVSVKIDRFETLSTIYREELGRALAAFKVELPEE